MNQEKIRKEQNAELLQDMAHDKLEFFETVRSHVENDLLYKDTGEWHTSGFIRGI